MSLLRGGVNRVGLLEDLLSLRHLRSYRLPKNEKKSIAAHYDKRGHKTEPALP